MILNHQQVTSHLAQIRIGTIVQHRTSMISRQPSTIFVHFPFSFELKLMLKLSQHKSAKTRASFQRQKLSLSLWSTIYAEYGIRQHALLELGAHHHPRTHHHPLLSISAILITKCALNHAANFHQFQEPCRLKQSHRQGKINERG